MLFLAGLKNYEKAAYSCREQSVQTGKAQKADEVPDVPQANTSSHQRTVVVVDLDADIAICTMVGSWWSIDIAGVTIRKNFNRLILSQDCDGLVG